jgi:hypothetical protein
MYFHGRERPDPQSRLLSLSFLSDLSLFVPAELGASRDRSNISRIASFPLLFYFLFYIVCLNAHEVPARRASRLRGRVLTTAFPEWSTVDSFSRPPATVPPRRKDLSVSSRSTRRATRSPHVPDCANRTQTPPGCGWRRRQAPTRLFVERHKRFLSKAHACWSDGAAHACRDRSNIRELRLLSYIFIFCSMWSDGAENRLCSSKRVRFGVTF